MTWKSLTPYILDCLCSEKRPNVRHHQLPKTKPLPSVESLGPPPTKPQKPPAVNLQALQRWTAAVPKTHRQGEENAPTPTSRAHSQPVGVSAGSRAGRHPQSPPSPHELPGDNAELRLRGAGHPSLLILMQRPWQLAGEMTDLQGSAPYRSPASPLPLRALHLITASPSKRKKVKRSGAGRQSAFLFPTKPVLSTQPVQ